MILIKSLEIILDRALIYLASFLSVFSSCFYRPTTLEMKKNKKDKQSNSLLTLQGSIIPCNTHHYF